MKGQLIIETICQLRLQWYSKAVCRTNFSGTQVKQRHIDTVTELTEIVKKRKIYKEEV